MSDAQKPNYEQIQRRAYEIYLERGGGDGQEHEDWFTAEREFMDSIPRELPPAIEALPQQEKTEDRAPRTDGNRSRKKSATSSGSASS